MEPTVFKYLRVTLNNHLSLKEHLNFVAGNIAQRMGIVSRIRTESANNIYKSNDLTTSRIPFTVTLSSNDVVEKTKRRLNVYIIELATLFSSIQKRWPVTPSLCYTSIKLS